MMLTPSLFGESMNKTDTKACSQYTIHTFVDTLIEFIQHGCSSELSSISISSLEQVIVGYSQLPITMRLSCICFRLQKVFMVQLRATCKRYFRA